MPASRVTSVNRIVSVAPDSDDAAGQHGAERRSVAASSSRALPSGVRPFDVRCDRAAPIFDRHPAGTLEQLELPRRLFGMPRLLQRDGECVSRFMLLGHQVESPAERRDRFGGATGIEVDLADDGVRLGVARIDRQGGGVAR